MPITLTITSAHKDLLGDDSVHRFGESGGTIGRGLQNDWILPDPERFISGRHATIDCRKGLYYLADTSTNGVYVNDEDTPLGRGNPRRLFNGDRLRMGDFEFLVTIDDGEDLDIRDHTHENAFHDDFELRVAEEPLRTGVQLLDEEELTGDSEFHSTLFGTARMDREPKEKKKPASAPRRQIEQRAAANEPANDTDAEALLTTFLAAAGIDRADIHPSVDPYEVMQNAGEVMREFVDGITEMLASRANLKSMFRLDQTTVLPRHNNPMKIAVNTEDSMKQLLVGHPGEYLGPLDSAREVCRDLKFHQDAMLAAMTSAFNEFADRLDPEELKESFDRTLSRKPLFGSFAKLKYWQLYCDLYPVMTQPGTGPFPHQFGEDFVRAYERHLADYKRNERKDGKAA